MASFFRASSALLAAMVVSFAPAAAQGEGGPYAYSVLGPAQRLPNGGRPVAKTAFPAIKDWSSLKITLTRSMCYGTCPDYRVEITGEGTVEFDGRQFVAVPGHHTERIRPEAVRTLFEEFAKADFFWAYDEYSARNITDMPPYSLSLSFDGRKKTIRDYVGPAVGMPKALWQLEERVDAASGSDKWVKGNDETFASLQADHWDFQAEDDTHQSLPGAAAAHGRTELVRQLLAAGVRANTKYGCQGVAAAAQAHPNPELVKLLLDAGAPLTADATGQNSEESFFMGAPCDLLFSAASGGNSEIMRMVLARHPQIDRRGFGGRTALMWVVDGGGRGGDEMRDYGAIIHMLVAAGTDVNARDEKGETALMKSYDGPLTQVLLNVGADPWLVNADGKTAAEIQESIQGKDNPAVLVLKRWMAAHPKHP